MSLPNQIISSEIEPVLSHPEKLCIAPYYRLIRCTKLLLNALNFDGFSLFCIIFKNCPFWLYCLLSPICWLKDFTNVQTSNVITFPPLKYGIFKDTILLQHKNTKIVVSFCGYKNNYLFPLPYYWNMTNVDEQNLKYIFLCGFFIMGHNRDKTIDDKLIFPQLLSEQKSGKYLWDKRVVNQFNYHWDKIPSYR